MEDLYASECRLQFIVRGMKGDIESRQTQRLRHRGSTGAKPNVFFAAA